MVMKFKIFTVFCFFSFIFPAFSSSIEDKVAEMKEKNKYITNPNDFRCPILDIHFEVVPKYGNTVVDYSKSKAEINSLNTANQAKNESPLQSLVPINAKLDVHGLIEIMDAGRVKFPHQIASLSFYIAGVPYKKYCLLADKLIYELGAREILIRIPNDFNANKCVSSEILKHELNHVKIYRTLLSKYSKTTYIDGSKVLKRFTIPRARNTEEEAKAEFDFLNNAISEVINKYSNLMDEESTRLNHEFDVEDYKRDLLNKNCGYNINKSP